MDGAARRRDPARAPGLWSPVAAAYTVLRGPLAAAERRLNSPGSAASTPLWSRLADVADGQGQVPETVNALLGATVQGWSLVEEDGLSKIMLIGSIGVEATELAAVQALALLLGLKRCRRIGCGEVFLDWTNAGTRRQCRAHGRFSR